MFYLILLLLVTAYGVQGIDEADTRIVGGKDVVEDSKPFVVSLRMMFRNYEKPRHFCGGSIIAPKWVLSAAHCTVNKPANLITVVAGTIYLSKGGSVHHVEEIINHNFDREHAQNDISLIKIKDTFKYSKHIAPIKLPKKDIGGGETVAIAGWGYLDKEGTKIPDTMQVVPLKTLTNQQCRESKFSKFLFQYPITDNQICTYTKEGEGVCQGDSGGPVYRVNVVIGLVALNVPCARGYPDIHTRVYKYRDWILKHINEKKS